MSHEEKAIKIFWEKFNCSQAVLGAFAEELGMSEEQAMKVALCFSAGARKGEVCGACTGALMVLGSLYGQYDQSDAKSRQVANEVNDKMMKRFAEVCGSYLCNDLLKCDISQKEGVEYALENHLFTEFCPKMVANAVEILEQIIAEQA